MFMENKSFMLHDIILSQLFLIYLDAWWNRILAWLATIYSKLSETRVSSHQHDCHEKDSGETREQTKCKVRELCRASVRRAKTRDLREFYIPRHDQDDPSFTRVRLTKVSSPIGGNPAASRNLGLAPNFRKEL